MSIHIHKYVYTYTRTHRTCGSVEQRSPRRGSISRASSLFISWRTRGGERGPTDPRLPRERRRRGAWTGFASPRLVTPEFYLAYIWTGCDCNSIPLNERGDLLRGSPAIDARCTISIDRVKDRSSSWTDNARKREEKIGRATISCSCAIMQWSAGRRREKDEQYEVLPELLQAHLAAATGASGESRKQTRLASRRRGRVGFCFRLARTRDDDDWLLSFRNVSVVRPETSRYFIYNCASLLPNAIDMDEQVRNELPCESTTPYRLNCTKNYFAMSLSLRNLYRNS